MTLTHCRQAHDLYRDLGDRYYEAFIRTHLGDTDGARVAWQHALAILTDIDDPDADTVRTKLHHLITSNHRRDRTVTMASVVE